MGFGNGRWRLRLRRRSGAARDKEDLYVVDSGLWSEERVCGGWEKFLKSFPCLLLGETIISVDEKKCFFHFLFVPLSS